MSSTKYDPPAGPPPAYANNQAYNGAGPSSPSNTSSPYPLPAQPAGVHVPDARYASPGPYAQPAGPYGGAPPVGYYGAPPFGQQGYYQQGPPMAYPPQAQPVIVTRGHPDPEASFCEAMLATFACCCCLDACLLW